MNLEALMSPYVDTTRGPDAPEEPPARHRADWVWHEYEPRMDFVPRHRANLSLN